MEIEEKFARVLAESHGLRDNAPIEVVKPWMRDARLAAGFFEGYYGNELARLREKLSDALAAGGNHKSDCAVYNAPAFEPGPCDCGASLTPPSESGAGAREDVERVVAVEKIECVPFSHPFDDAAVDPIWRIEINGYCADFEHREAAENFAAAINALASSPTEQMREALEQIDCPWYDTDGAIDEIRSIARQALGGNHD